MKKNNIYINRREMGANFQYELENIMIRSCGGKIYWNFYQANTIVTNQVLTNDR